MFMGAGVPAVAGLRTGLACAAALGHLAGDPLRLREIAAAAASGLGSNGLPALAEHKAKELLRAACLPVVAGRLAASEDDAVAALDELGAPLALKLSAPALLHKTELGALALGLRDAGEVRAAHRRLAGLGLDGASMLVERMAGPGVELLVSPPRRRRARARGRARRNVDGAVRRRRDRAAAGERRPRRACAPLTARRTAPHRRARAGTGRPRRGRGARRGRRRPPDRPGSFADRAESCAGGRGRRGGGDAVAA